MAQLDKSLHHCVVKTTGNYGALLVEMLVETQIAVSVLNPKQIKHLAKVMSSVTKTDQVDAQLIGVYGSKLEPKSYTMPTATIRDVKQQKTLLAHFKKQLKMSCNLLESFIEIIMVKLFLM